LALAAPSSQLRLDGHGGDLEETSATHGGAGGEGAAAEEAEESRGFALVEFGKDKKLLQHPAR
jgi:hypothetical protein